MLGHKIRRLRRDRSITQAQLAQRLGISTSYLNLIESNQRPVTVEILLKIGEIFDVELPTFAEDEGERLLVGLTEVFGDPLFAQSQRAGIVPSRQELLDLATQTPAAAEAILTLYRSYRESRDTLSLLGDDPAAAADHPAPSVSPFDDITEWAQGRDHHFADLEEAAEEVWRAAGIEEGDLLRGLTRYLEQELSLKVKVMPVNVMGMVRRRYDLHSRRVLLSEMLPLASRAFQLAGQIALLRYRPLLDELVASTGIKGEDSARLGRIFFANYLAGAVMMPYDRFWRAATALRYDIELLQNRFGASFEQVGVRLTTLLRPGAKGIPFVLIRGDKAGNVSKRLGGARTAFARQGGACPRWNLYDAFRSPGQTLVQVSEMPDGMRWFSIARLVTKPGTGYHAPGKSFALALACDVAHAAGIVYADGIDFRSDRAAVPIGLHCRLCERLDCDQRAFPPLNHRLIVDENLRGPNSYLFESRPA